MRSCLALVVASALALAGCASDDAPADAGADAGVTTDAGAPDSGRFETPCGAATCGEAELCRVDPTGPCVAQDAGTCGAGEELCQSGGLTGCTSARTYACVALPAACAERPSCVCLLAIDVCGAGASCILPQGQGATIECPFP
ncbi:hypothetical protein L6R52_13800 [Myxococcota bacterium]|nr:hypothetical protein [Myxococcota bacterium]